MPGRRTASRIAVSGRIPDRARFPVRVIPECVDADLSRSYAGAHGTAVFFALTFFVLCALSQPAWCGPVFERATKSGTIKLGLPYNFVPQGFMKPTGEWVGFEVDLGEELARHLNLKLEKVKVNDKTWGQMLSTGRIDAAFCRIRHTRSLESQFDFSVPFFFDSLKILVPKGSIKTVSDLKAQKIAAVQGSSAEKAAMRLLKDAGDEQAQKNVVSFPDRPSCFMAMGRDKIAGWIDTGMTLLEYSFRNPARFDMIDVSNSLEEVSVALPQDDSAWRDLINFAIQDMVADGSLYRIYDQWFGTDTPYPFPRKRSIEIWPE